MFVWTYSYSTGGYNLNKSKNILNNYSVLILILAIILIVFLLILISGISAKSKPEETAEGISFISAEAKKDPQKVDVIVREREAEKQKAAAEELRKKQADEFVKSLEDGKESVWGQFKDFVIMGDSRAVGFYYFKFLDKSRVFAGGGKTIRDIPSYMEDLKTVNPSYVYLCFGLNDTGIGHWKTAEEYVKEMDQRIDEIQKAVPGCKVIVNSILPATEEALAKNPSWRKIPAFSSGVEKLCKTKENVVFVNNDELAKAFMSKYWQPDGVHLKPEFYPYWAKNMLLAAYGS